MGIEQNITEKKSRIKKMAQYRKRW